ncbi:MAG: zinc ABC transporter substrate-binding protein, partial [Verrucomicrobiae bacterium]|nr:zinc ABC transporter substrate-binding protein [Verrucomicrobiae bacterium]
MRSFPSLSSVSLRFSAGVLAVGLGLVSCGRDAAPPRTGKPVVFVSIAPLAGLASRIAGDRATVEVLADPNADPHGFSPTPKQLVALGDASLFLTVGMPFEARLVEKLESGANHLKIVNVADGVERLELDEDHAHHHDHSHEKGETESDHHDDHGDEDAGDPHVWLSPPLLREQAIAIEHALNAIDPDGHDLYHANLETLLAEIDSLHADLEAALAPMKGQAFYVFHGAFGYFAQAYDLKQEAIETGGRSPEPKRIFELIEQAKQEGVKLILVQPQFDTKSAQAIADGIGGTVVAVNPMGADVFATLRTLADQVKATRGE